MTKFLIYTLPEWLANRYPKRKPTSFWRVWWWLGAHGMYKVLWNLRANYESGYCK